MSDFFALAWRSDIRTRALKVALLVGTVLIGINQGDVILAGSLEFEHWIKMALTYCVPYAVSTYSSVRAQS